MSNLNQARYGARVFWSDADDAYIATVPEFDSVSAFGPTVEEAVAELQAALDLTLDTYESEGWELPAPNAEPEYSGQFRLRLPKSLHQWLATTAEAEGVSLNTLAVHLLSRARGATDATERAAGRMQAVEASLRASIEGVQAAVSAARQEASNQVVLMKEGVHMSENAPGAYATTTILQTYSVPKMQVSKSGWGN